MIHSFNLPQRKSADKTVCFRCICSSGRRKIISMEILQNPTLSTQMLYFHISDAILPVSFSLGLHELTSVEQIPDYKVSVQKSNDCF